MLGLVRKGGKISQPTIVRRREWLKARNPCHEIGPRTNEARHKFADARGGIGCCKAARRNRKIHWHRSGLPRNHLAYLVSAVIQRRTEVVQDFLDGQLDFERHRASEKGLLIRVAVIVSDPCSPFLCSRYQSLRGFKARKSFPPRKSSEPLDWHCLDECASVSRRDESCVILPNIIFVLVAIIANASNYKNVLSVRPGRVL